MTIHLISFASILHKQASLRNSHEAILSELEKYYTVKLIDYHFYRYRRCGKTGHPALRTSSPPRHFIGRWHAELTCCGIGNIYMAPWKGNEE